MTLAHLAMLPACLLPGIGRRMTGGGLSDWTGRDCGKILPRTLFALAAVAVVALGGEPWPVLIAICVVTWCADAVGMMGGMSFGTSTPDVTPLAKAAGLIGHGAA